jgi:anti-sigma-K factor RskA
MPAIMIPSDREQLDVLAGEYVLGVLDPPRMREIEATLGENAVLREAVSFWEQKLHPLSALASQVEPPQGAWNAIAARIAEASNKSAAAQGWKGAGPWRWATAGFAAAAAALLLYIAIAPVAPPLVAVLHTPQQQAASWIATTSDGGLHLSAVANEVPPPGRTFELWAIAPDAKRPEPLGVIPSNGTLRIAALPRGLGEGATLAISIEPPGGSPTGQPTGPVVFTGALRAI